MLNLAAPPNKCRRFCPVRLGLMEPKNHSSYEHFSNPDPPTPICGLKK